MGTPRVSSNAASAALAVAVALLSFGCPPAQEPAARPTVPSAPPKRPPGAEVPSQSPIDTPNQHAMFMLGDQTLFVEHMPMFTKEDHMYQVVLEAELPAEVMAAYRRVRQESPQKVPNLVNSESAQFVLPSVATGALREYPVDVFADYDVVNADGTEQLFSAVPMKVKRVVVYRHFNYSFDYPAELTYILFGKGDEAHLTHYIARDPDFQHLLTLPGPPDWISQEQLQAGVELNVVGLPGDEVLCSSPLTAPEYKVRFQGWLNPELTLSLGASPTRWYSTANLLNAIDPCAKPGEAGQAPSGMGSH